MYSYTNAYIDTPGLALGARYGHGGGVAEGGTCDLGRLAGSWVKLVMKGFHPNRNPGTGVLGFHVLGFPPAVAILYPRGFCI